MGWHFKHGYRIRLGLIIIKDRVKYKDEGRTRVFLPGKHPAKMTWRTTARSFFSISKNNIFSLQKIKLESPMVVSVSVLRWVLMGEAARRRCSCLFGDPRPSWRLRGGLSAAAPRCIAGSVPWWSGGAAVSERRSSGGSSASEGRPSNGPCEAKMAWNHRRFPLMKRELQCNSSYCKHASKIEC